MSKEKNPHPNLLKTEEKEEEKNEKKQTDWTLHDNRMSVSSSKIKVKANISDPMTPSYSKVSCLLFVDYVVSWCVNPNSLE